MMACHGHEFMEKPKKKKKDKKTKQEKR